MSIQVATVRDLQSAEHLKSQALAESDKARALELWSSARRFDPESATLLGHEALILLDLGRPEEALRLLLPTLPRWPRLIHLMNLAGVALYELRYAQAAAQLFKHCLWLDPHYPSAHQSLLNAENLKNPRRTPAQIRQIIKETLSAAEGTSPPRLSVCMIVRDEEEFIQGALDSVKGLAWEIIVVDTGSKDSTVALAEAAGAKLSFFEWCGDFSAARNVSLERASGEWILVLDADERLLPESHTVIRAVMEEYSGQLRVICPRVRNYTRAGRYLNDGFSGRLFPRREELIFEGQVHEEVGRGMPGITTDYRLDIGLDHYGADPEVMHEKAKDARNLKLLEERLAEDPEALITWFYLASQHWIGGRTEQALEAFERVLNLYERAPSRFGMAVRHVPVPYSYVGAVRANLDLQRPQAAQAVARRGLARFPENPDLWYHAAFAWLQMGDASEARQLLERAAEGRLKGYALISMHDPSIPAWKAEKSLADLEFEAGEQAAALRRYEALYERLPEGEEQVTAAARMLELAADLGEYQALISHSLRYLGLKPEQREVALQVVQLLIQRQGLEPAAELLKALLALEALSDWSEAWMALGQLQEEMGADREALSCYERVAENQPQDPRFWLRLAQLLLRLNQTQAAAEAFRVAKSLHSGAQG